MWGRLEEDLGTLGVVHEVVEHVATRPFRLDHARIPAPQVGHAARPHLLRPDRRTDRGIALDRCAVVEPFPRQERRVVRQEERVDRGVRPSFVLDTASLVADLDDECAVHRGDCELIHDGRL